MSLLNILLSQNLITGPIPEGNTSHSSMGAFKTFLLGLKQFSGDETYLVFGRVLHEHLQFVEDESFRAADYSNLVVAERQAILSICENVRKNKVLLSLLKNSNRELKEYVFINGVKVAIIIDVEQEGTSTVLDWKSTSCSSEGVFIAKALEFDYVKQGLTYKIGKGRKNCYFVGLQKQPPHNIYIMDVRRYANEELYAKQELDLLLYCFSKYGKAIIPGQTVVPIKTADNNLKQLKMGSTKGKEALKAIAEQHKIYQAAIKAAAKEGVKLSKLHDKFPKKELEEYKEKLEKFVVV